MASVTSAKTVGSIKYPLLENLYPPARYLAPSLFPASIYLIIESNYILST